MKINKVVHQTGPFKSLEEFPVSLKKIYFNNKIKNPTYNFIYYNDEDCDKIIKEFDELVYRAYNMLIPTAYKADIFRMVILYLHGGIYGDFSQEFIKPLSSFINHNLDIILIENFEICFIASCSKNEIIRYILKHQVNNILNKNYGNSKLDITGPDACKKAFKIITGKYNFKKLKISILGRKIFLGNILKKFLYGILKKKRDLMYIVDKNNNKLIKLYVNNHKNIISNRNKKYNYGYLYTNKMVFGEKYNQRISLINNYTIIIFAFIVFLFFLIY